MMSFPTRYLRLKRREEKSSEVTCIDQCWLLRCENKGCFERRKTCARSTIPTRLGLDGSKLRKQWQVLPPRCSSCHHTLYPGEESPGSLKARAWRYCRCTSESTSSTTQVSGFSA